MDVESPTPVRIQPRWFVKAFWSGHRLVYRLSRGHVGLWRERPGGWGAMSVTTTGRRSGLERTVILGYFEDGETLVTLAMNGWAPPEPAWWLNLQADPHATVTAKGETRTMVAHAATGAERARLWARWREIDRGLDGYAARRPHETAVVVLEPDPAG